MDSEYLKYLAKSKNLKLCELGEMLGLNKHYFYRKLKNGTWDISDMKKLKDILKMTENDFKKVFGLNFDD